MTIMFFVFERHDLPTPEACVIRLDTSYIQIRTAENIALNVVARAQGLLGNRRVLCPKRAMRAVTGFRGGGQVNIAAVTDHEIWEWSRDLAGEIYEWVVSPYQDRRGRDLPWKTVRRMGQYEQRVIMLLGAAKGVIKGALRRAGVPYEEATYAKSRA